MDSFVPAGQECLVERIFRLFPALDGSSQGRKSGLCHFFIVDGAGQFSSGKEEPLEETSLLLLLFPCFFNSSGEGFLRSCCLRFFSDQRQKFLQPFFTAHPGKDFFSGFSCDQGNDFSCFPIGKAGRFFFVFADKSREETGAFSGKKGFCRLADFFIVEEFSVGEFHDRSSEGAFQKACLVDQGIADGGQFPDDGILVRRNQRLVRQMEAPPEEGFDGDPVGAAADKAGLGQEVEDGNGFASAPRASMLKDHCRAKEDGGGEEEAVGCLVSFHSAPPTSGIRKKSNPRMAPKREPFRRMAAVSSETASFARSAIVLPSIVESLSVTAFPIDS